MKKTLSIWVILTFGFGGLLAAGIGASLFVGLSTAFHNTRDLLSENAEGLVLRIEEEIESRLLPIERQARFIEKQVWTGKLNLRDQDDPETAAFFRSFLGAAPQVSLVGIMRTDFSYEGWLQDDVPVPPSNYSDNPVVKEWLDAGREGPAPQWGPPFWFQEMDSAVIIHETPLFDQQGYIGYLTFVVPISTLSKDIADISDTSFILSGDSDVLAHPLMIGWRPLDSTTDADAAAIYAGKSALMPVGDLGDPVLERIWTADDADLPLLGRMKNAKGVAIELGGEWYLMLYKPVEGFGPKTWYIGTYLSSNQAWSSWVRLFEAGIAGIVVLLIATIASLLMSRRLSRPIEALAEASRAVREDRLNDVPTFPKSRITELSAAMKSFARMVEGLAERDRIRATLGRYVPERVAQRLLSQEGVLEPVEAEATILFCDVAGFTALTEKLGPVRIVEVLNAYFSSMTKIIEARGGVVTQFQGDAILAIFNTPIPADNHASQACRAAMEMIHTVERESFAGEVLKCRIGVNTGPIVAGAVGAEDRLTYTVHGDAVNLAARIEALNKELGTTVLMTEATARLAPEVVWHEAGTVSVRGQHGDVTVFRPG